MVIFELCQEPAPDFLLSPSVSCTPRSAGGPGAPAPSSAGATAWRAGWTSSMRRSRPWADWMDLAVGVVGVGSLALPAHLHPLQPVLHSHELVRDPDKRVGRVGLLDLLSGLVLDRVVGDRDKGADHLVAVAGLLVLDLQGILQLDHEHQV